MLEVLSLGQADGEIEDRKGARYYATHAKRTKTLGRCRARWIEGNHSKSTTKAGRPEFRTADASRTGAKRCLVARANKML